MDTCDDVVLVDGRWDEESKAMSPRGTKACLVALLQGATGARAHSPPPLFLATVLVLSRKRTAAIGNAVAYEYVFAADTKSLECANKSCRKADELLAHVDPSSSSIQACNARQTSTDISRARVNMTSP